MMHVLKEMMNHTETKEFSGMITRKPTTEELVKALSYYCSELLFSQMVFENTEKFGLDINDAEAIVHFLDTAAAEQTDYLASLQANNYPNLEEVLKGFMDLERISFEDTAIVYDFIYFKTRIIQVYSLRMIPDPNSSEKNKLIMKYKLYLFCNKCDEVHPYESDLIISV